MCMQRPLQHLEINLNAQCCLVQVATSNEMVLPKIEIPFSGLVIREGPSYLLAVVTIRSALKQLTGPTVPGALDFSRSNEADERGRRSGRMVGRLGRGGEKFEAGCLGTGPRMGFP